METFGKVCLFLILFIPNPVGMVLWLALIAYVMFGAIKGVDKGTSGE